MCDAGLHLPCHSDDPGCGAACGPCREEADALAGVPRDDVLLQRQDAEAAVLWAAEEHVSGQASKSTWPKLLLAALPPRLRQRCNRWPLLRLLLLLLPPLPSVGCSLLSLLKVLLPRDWVLAAVYHSGGGALEFRQHIGWRQARKLRVVQQLGDTVC